MRRRRIRLGDAIMIAGERAILKRFINDDGDDHPSAVKGWLWERTGIPSISRGFQRYKNAFTGKGFKTNAEVENSRLRKENAALKQSQQPPKPKQPQPQQAKPAKPTQAPKPPQPAKPTQAPKPASPAQPQHDDFYDLIW